MKPMTPIEMELLGKSKTDDARTSVRQSSINKIRFRSDSFQTQLKDFTSLRKLAGQLRQHVIDRLPQYLEQVEDRLKAHGVNVHWAADAEEARRIVGELCKAAKVKTIAKAKSMVTEEIELNPYLESLGYQPIETDLGEFVVQLDGDHPSHIVTPMIHKNRKTVATLFHREGLGEYSEDAEELTQQARHHMRKIFEQTEIGITGANFVAADTGRIITVSNEGNLRYTSSVSKIHIALTGIEKVLARESEMAVFLKILPRSSTGQDMTVYTQFLSGPRQQSSCGTPQQVHLIFLDNGRSNLLGGKYHEMLRCIRCGACLNVCPVYRSVTGHGYDSVYPGPMGSILSPLLGGESSLRQYAQLPKASSLCGACEEVCPVAIPIPRLLLSLREELHDQGLSLPGSPPFGIWSRLATHPALWRIAMKIGKGIGWGPVKMARIHAFQSWLLDRQLPSWPKESFRDAWVKRKKESKGQPH